MPMPRYNSERSRLPDPTPGHGPTGDLPPLVRGVVACMGSMLAPRWRSALFRRSSNHASHPRCPSPELAGTFAPWSWSSHSQGRWGPHPFVMAHAPERRDGVLTALTLWQPLELGSARLTCPTGRTGAGERLYASEDFSLVPSRRTLDLSLAHRRPLGTGEFMVAVGRTGNPGHSTARAEHRAGIAWRKRF